MERREEIMERLAEMLDIGYKEAEDAYCSGGIEAYEKIYDYWDRRIEEEWRCWMEKKKQMLKGM